MRRAIGCALVGFGSFAILEAADVSALWIEPKDIAARDLFHGPGGETRAAPAGATYRFESKETGGHSVGYYVFGPDGRKWKVKIGDEAQSEIAVSRLLWAIGYHQPVLTYVSRWRMTGHEPPEAKPGRFRLASDHETEGPWSYRDNPFVGTRELHGLIAANLLLNNWDLAASNNRIYEIEGRRLYVAQDLGGSLGKTRWPIGTRNRIDDFESQGYIRGIENGRPDFDYYGRHRGIVRKVTAEDVAWVCGLLAKLTDRQLADAFRAAHYPQDVAERYVRKIEEKIREGVALGAAGSR